MKQTIEWGNATVSRVAQGVRWGQLMHVETSKELLAICITRSGRIQFGWVAKKSHSPFLDMALNVTNKKRKCIANKTNV
jgi:hypothetical protein